MALLRALVVSLVTLRLRTRAGTGAPAFLDPVKAGGNKVGGSEAFANLLGGATPLSSESFRVHTRAFIYGSLVRNGAAAFNGTNSSGVRCPWRFGNLNNGANAGLGCENGNNTPSNTNWNGRPRLSDNKPLYAVILHL